MKEGVNGRPDRDGVGLNTVGATYVLGRQVEETGKEEFLCRYCKIF
jgi:hypothetical protein